MSWPMLPTTPSRPAPDRTSARRRASHHGAGDNLDRYASVAQGIERWFPVPKVAGSIPVGGTDAKSRPEGAAFSRHRPLSGERTRSRAHAVRCSARCEAASGEAVGIQSGARTRKAVPKGRLFTGAGARKIGPEPKPRADHLRFLVSVSRSLSGPFRFRYRFARPKILTARRSSRVHFEVTSP